ncbi:sensor histidine kinase [Clostridium sp.]|jgi:signal transduction histidine kinase|uniref:sensor histidine kinase n=1 Tax=Clostridium sp. TaxID=1506 RepID=UPI002FDEE2BA
MKFLIIILIIFSIILLIRLIFIKIEIRNITNQLNDYNNLKLHKKVDVKLFDIDIENLAASVNKHIDINIQDKVTQKQTEYEIRKSIANISHDLRTPLTSVIGYMEMIKSKKLSCKKQDEYIDIALKRAYFLKELLNDFFELSIIESPEYNLKVEYINLNNILCEVVTTLYDNFAAKNITPRINLPDKDIIVVANKAASKRVIQNLITNMIKYAYGEVSITLKKDGDFAVIITSNLAKTLKAHDLNLLFSRFYKADLSRTNSNNTGLGLSIAKNLMNKMNGLIYAKLDKDILYIFCKWKLIKS